MDADHRVITIDRHVWTMKSPAHHTEVDKAMAVANQERHRLRSAGAYTGDVFVSADDEHVIVSFDVRRPEADELPTTAPTDTEATDA
ncbi:hypothetical protein ACF06P_35650 [Streptomyces sp. NPDC015684]|uniref:hypothetical protein n=1 Tax=Streptomyces sp. NPDC015684 TaxID=3364963 RepID=UPI003702A35A